MYYQNYEEYMRNVLGYQIEPTYNNYIRDCNTIYQSNIELESMYPEIYKKLNPIICSVCEKNNESITKESIERMVDEVYHKVEINNEIWLKINIDDNTRKNEEIKNTNVTTNLGRNIQEYEKIKQYNQNENKTRKQGNLLLRDLIKILLLNKIISNNIYNNKLPRLRPTFAREITPPIIPIM